MEMRGTGVSFAHPVNKALGGLISLEDSQRGLNAALPFLKGLDDPGAKENKQKKWGGGLRDWAVEDEASLAFNGLSGRSRRKELLIVMFLI